MNLQVAAPLNDQQIIILAAAQLLAGGAVETPADAVTRACEIVAESILQKESVAVALTARDPEYIAKRTAEIEEQEAMAQAAQRSKLVLPISAMPAAVDPRRGRRQ